MKALITGGANGIGSAIAKKLSQTHDILIADIKMHPTFKTIQIDVTNEEQYTQLPKEVDLLVLNAGIMKRGTLTESTTADFESLFSVNVKGYWLILKHIKAKEIIVVTSYYALTPPSNPGLYAVTKAADATLGKCVGAKIAYLGPVKTAMNNPTEKKYRDDPEFVAEKISELHFSKNKVLYWDGREYAFSQEYI